LTHLHQLLHFKTSSEASPQTDEHVVYGSTEHWL
jgi:hypothetical protein